MDERASRARYNLQLTRRLGHSASPSAELKGERASDMPVGKKASATGRREVTGDFPEWGKKRGVAWRGKEAKDGTETDGFYGSETPFPNRRLSLNLSQHFLFLNLFSSSLSFSPLPSNQLNPLHLVKREQLLRFCLARSLRPSVAPRRFFSLAFLPLHTPSTSTVAPPVRSTHRSLLRLDLNQRA